MTQAAFYQSVGAELTHYDVDVAGATLTRRESVRLPSNVQYVWPHPSRQYLTVSTSDAPSGNTPDKGEVHRLCVLKVAADGSLTLHGEGQPLPSPLKVIIAQNICPCGVMNEKETSST